MARKKKTEQPLIGVPVVTPSKEINEELLKEIVKKSEIENFVEVVFIEGESRTHNFYPYEYVDFDYTISKETLNEIKFVKKEHIASYNKHSASVAVTQEQIKTLKELHGIDVEEMCKNVLLQEASYGLNKGVMTKITEIADKTYLAEYNILDKFLSFLTKLLNNKHVKVSYTKKVKVHNTKHLIQLILKEANKIFQKSRFGAGNYAICSLKTATMLSDNPNFVFAPMSSKLNSSSGLTYPIGYIADIVVYANANVPFSDNGVYIGFKPQPKFPGIKVFVYANDLQITISTQGTDAPRINLMMRYSVEPVGNSANNMYRKFIYKGKNLF